MLPETVESLIDVQLQCGVEEVRCHCKVHDHHHAERAAAREEARLRVLQDAAQPEHRTEQGGDDVEDAHHHI